MLCKYRFHPEFLKNSKVTLQISDKYSIKLIGVVAVEISRINTNGANNQLGLNKDAEPKVVKPDSPVMDIQNKSVDVKKEVKDVNNLKEAVDMANKALFKNNTHLKFQIHGKTKEVMVKIINDETGDVVKEIPPEKMLDMVAKLWEIAGILIDERR